MNRTGVLFAVTTLLASAVATAQAELKVYTTDGKVLTLPVEKSRVRSIEFSEETRQARKPASHQVFSAIPSQDSANFKENLELNLSVDTTRWDRTPYHMTSPFEKEIVISEGQRCFLAGDAAGSKGWSVDNFLLIEISSDEGTKRFIAGVSEPVSYKGRELKRLGGSSTNFNAGDIDLTALLPKNETVQLRISALDYGGVGHISDLFLIIK